MKPVLILTAGVLLFGVTAAYGSDLKAVDPVTGKAPQPVVQPKVKPTPKPVAKTEGECTGDYGTSIDFVDTPKEAAEKAKKDEKLVFVLHVSGNFEDPRFT